MIRVNYVNGLGNRLFMYVVGRILAQELDFALQAPPLEGFPGTSDPVGRKSFPDGDQQILRGMKFNLQEILGNTAPRTIIVEGLFQNYDYIRPYKNDIRTSWLRLEPSALPASLPDPEDLVLHVRRGDYVKNRWALPFSYYQSIIDQTPFRSLVIITNMPQDPFFFRFAKYSPEIPHLSSLQAFSFMVHSNQLVLSASTFSWWAGFLSKARIIYFPKPDSGIWSDRSNKRTGIDLFVDDEDRYVIQRSDEVYQPGPLESLYYKTLSNVQTRPRLRNALKVLRLIHEDEDASIRLGPQVVSAKKPGQNGS